MTDMNIDLNGQRRRRQLACATQVSRKTSRSLLNYALTLPFKRRRVAVARLLIESVKALTLQLSLSICLVYFL